MENVFFEISEFRCGTVLAHPVGMGQRPVSRLTRAGTQSGAVVYARSNTPPEAQAIQRRHCIDRESASLCKPGTMLVGHDIPNGLGLRCSLWVVLTR